MLVLPREKLEQRGLSSLTDSDLISVILGTGADGRKVWDIARSVTRIVGKGVSEAEAVTWRDFVRLKGVGKVKAMQVACALELGRRLYAEDKGGFMIRDRSDVVEMFRYLRQRKQECVIVVALDARNGVIARKTVAVGGLNKAVVEPREVFSWVLSVGAAAIILVHNHPSGDTRASGADEQFAERMKEAGSLLGVEMLDQVIV